MTRGDRGWPSARSARAPHWLPIRRRTRRCGRSGWRAGSRESIAAEAAGSRGRRREAASSAAGRTFVLPMHLLHYNVVLVARRATSSRATCAGRWPMLSPEA
eukprot:1405793-Prymnesium_polylepis.1